MKRILMFTVCGLLVAAGSLGTFSTAGENEPVLEENVYGSPDTGSMVREFETELEKTRIATDPIEIERRQYIPKFMRRYTGTVEGTVTLVGDNVMRMSEAGTRFEYEISINNAQERALTTGFNIRAELRDGRLASYTEMGVPPDVEKIVYSAEGLPEDNMLERKEAY